MLSKACTYGILASLYIARESRKRDNYVPIGQMSEKLNISFHFLTKILQQLTSAGLLASMKGPKGGVRFKKPLHEITLLDIVIAIDGMELFQECLLGLPGCGDEEPCAVHNEWSKLREETYVLFKGKTLAETSAKIEDLNLRFALPKIMTD
ncbi:Rrf2 family transcriptional regulator [Balneolaceae bacterium ANBcel3]|nr:Rrf2 family transcriptional regulator [Balneolaceae bacterium ANBcel3]